MKKKVNIILPFTLKTGGIMVILRYANMLVDDGYDVKCYVPMIYYKFNFSGIIGILKRIKASFMNTFIRGKNVKWLSLKANLELVPFITDKYIRDADVVIATAWPTAVSVNKLNKSKGEKVYFIQGYEVWSGPSELVEKTYKYNMKQIVISKELKDIMINKFNSKNVQIVYNGIESESFFFYEGEKENFTISTLYHPDKIKGFDDALNVIKILKEKIPDVKIKCFGTTTPKKLPSYIEFYHNPSRKVLRDIYSSSNIYLFCSKNEGWGLTPLEAMACGAIVIGNNEGCLKEIGLNNENCIISDSNNIEKMANDVIKVLMNKELQESLRNKSVNTIKGISLDNSYNNLKCILFQ